MWRLHWRRAIFYSAITKRQHVSYIGKAWLESLGKRFSASCARVFYTRLRSIFLLTVRAATFHKYTERFDGNDGG